MANKQELILSIWFITLHLCVVLTSGSNVKQLYCWSGNDLDKFTSSNQSCSTGDTTQANSVSLKNESTDATDPANMTTITVNQPQINASRCYFFIYHVPTSDDYLRFSDKDKGEVIHASHEVSNFSCDFENICKDQPLNKAIETTVNGVNGTLECCDTNNCNFGKSENQLPNNHLSCYDVTYNGEGIPNATIQHCKSRNDVCMKVKVFGNDNYLEKYFCNETSLCDSEVKGVKIARCKNETLQNETMETCCCKGDRCLVPEFNYTLIINHQSNVENGTPTKTPCCASKKLDWMFVGGLIAAGVLVVAIVVGVLVVVSRCKRRQADNNRLTLAYSRIAADETGEEEDIQMLLP